MRTKYILFGIVMLLGLSITLFLGYKHFNRLTYTIADEYTYAVLQRDFDNSFILGRAGIDASKISDMDAEISKLDDEIRTDAELRLNFFKIRTDLQKTKTNALVKIKEYNIDLTGESFNHDDTSKILDLIKDDLVETAVNVAKNEGGLELTDAFIGYVTFSPIIDYSKWSNNVAPQMIDIVERIAVSRVDNLKVYQQLHKCYQTSITSKIEVIDTKVLLKCAEEHRNHISQEIDKVIIDLWIYQNEQRKQKNSQN